MTASLQEKTTQAELLNQQLTELQMLNVKLKQELSESVSATCKLRVFLTEVYRTVSPDISAQLSDTDVSVADAELNGLLVNVSSLHDRQQQLQAELEKKQLECLTIKSELEKCQQTINSEIKQLEADHIDKCRQIEDSFAADKKLLEDKISLLQDTLTSKESSLVSCQSEKELLVKEFEERLSLQKTQIDKEANDKCLVQIKEFEDKINCIREEHNGVVDRLTHSHEANIAEMKICQEGTEHEKKLLEIRLEELATKLSQVESELSSLQCKHKRLLEAVNQLQVKLLPVGGIVDLDADNVVEEITDLMDKWITAQQEEHKNSVKSLTEQLQSEVNQARSALVELEASHQQHAKKIEELTEELKEAAQEKRQHEKTLEEIKEKYEKVIEDLNEKLISQRDSVDVKSLGLVAEDYIPMQRHDDMVTQLRNELKLVSTIIVFRNDNNRNLYVYVIMVLNMHESHHSSSGCLPTMELLRYSNHFREPKTLT